MEQLLPNFNKIRLVSGVKTDTKFAFTLNKFPIQAVFAVVEPNKELSWTGSSLWTKAIDRMTLEPLSDATTRLQIEESLSGAFISLFMSQQQLTTQHMAWLTAIKKEAEKK